MGLLGKQLGSLSSVAPSQEQELVIQWLENLAPSPCSVAAEAGGILDTRNTIGIPNFDGLTQTGKVDE